MGSSIQREISESDYDGPVFPLEFRYYANMAYTPWTGSSILDVAFISHVEGIPEN
jgi:hypothetical protein